MTDTKRLTVLIIVALWCLCSLPFAHAQQCSEDQYASNTIVIKKKAVASVPAGGACTEPAAGTVLGGNSTQNDTASDYTVANTGYWTGAGHQVTWAETCLTTTASKMQLYIGNFFDTDRYCKGVIYDSTNARVAITDASNSNGIYGNWMDMPFSTPPTLTKGATYRLVYVCDGQEVNIYYNNAAGDLYSQGSFTYATPTNTLGGSDATLTATFAIRVVK